MVARSFESNEMRIRNPFSETLITELIEDPVLYGKLFSEEILIGETASVFKPLNVILTGPQGSGKSMILNLIRYQVLSQWVATLGGPPGPLKHLSPFLGISVNFDRTSIHRFGRRSFGPANGGEQGDIVAAADYLNHYLFREFLKSLEYVLSDQGERYAQWLGINRAQVDELVVAREIAKWRVWFGYYSDCGSLKDLLEKSEQRLEAWDDYLNINTDTIPTEVWTTKTTLGDPLHMMGNLLKELAGHSTRVSLFVVIDQYELLAELNPKLGTSLQRMINSLYKLRDPVVFYKLGARTYDWGKELRVWGSNAAIELHRDYITVNLADILGRSENSKWFFPDFAADVAYKRLASLAPNAKKDTIKELFGKYSSDEESEMYFGSRSDRRRLRLIGNRIPEGLSILVKANASTPIDLRLAGAWVLQRLQRHESEHQIETEIRSGEIPWQKAWWRKERLEVALLQIASISNQRKQYYGWSTLLHLSGSNIAAFLTICAEVWDLATGLGGNPLEAGTLPAKVQSDGMHAASRSWLLSDKIKQLGGRRRYDAVLRLGAAIHHGLITDLAISNPGHSGFSLRETDLWGYDNTFSDDRFRVAEFLRNSVSWAILEERPHTSKERGDISRRKWYLHPLLSPVLGIPNIRVKEPLYISADELYKWIFTDTPFEFRSRPSGGRHQYALPLDE